MHPYSLDLRTRVAACREPGARHVAQRFGVSVSFVKKLLRHEPKTGAKDGRQKYH